jgi:hypothetical protein
MPRQSRSVLAAAVAVVALAACESPIGPDPATLAPIDLVRFDVAFGGEEINDDLGGFDPVVGGSEMAFGGVALDALTAGTINVTVPAGATVQDAYLYWGSRDDTDDAADGEIGVSQISAAGPFTPVDGDYAGATTLGGNDSHSFRADLIAEGFTFGAGLNTVPLEVPSGQGVDGATLVITYDDGTPGSVVFRDGNDFAFEPVGQQTNEQTFTFASAAVDRTATLLIVVGDVELSRPNQIFITSGGAGDDQLDNALGDYAGNCGRNGAQWDTCAISVLVPAGSTQLSVQVLSWDDPTGVLPASLYWVLSALELPDAPPPPVCDGLTPGYWRNWSNHYSTAQFQQLVDWVNDNDYSGTDLTRAQITAILEYGGPDPVLKLKKFYYANLLTLALTDHPGLPNPDTAGLDGDCASASFPGDTLGEALDDAEAILANPGGYTRQQINAVKDILDAIANLNG